MFGDVHMLSHLQGASNRADLRRLKNLESDVVKLQEALKNQHTKHYEQIQHRDEIIQRQELELLTLMTQRTNLQQRAAIGTPARRDDEYESLVRQTYRLEERLAEREAQIAELQQEICGLKELLDETRSEHAAMEQTMTSLLTEDEQREKKHIGNIDLSGKRILYVGGHSKLTPHLRALVERHNGHFNHHDGGLEDSRGALQCNLTGADMVFCPVDCISHDACLRVKRHCQQQAKQFIPLRTSGISAFAAGLRQLSATVNDQVMELEQ